MIKAVFDTSVLVGALLTPKGLANGLIQSARENAFSLILSEEIITETRLTLFQSADLRQRYNYTEYEVFYFLHGLQLFSVIVSDLPTLQIVRDQNDDFILATAIKGCAEYLVSHDKDLLSLEEYQNIKIVSPKSFYELLGASQIVSE